MFPEELVQDFGQNLKNFVFFFCAKRSSKKIVGDVLDRKKAFLVCKNINLLYLRNWIFPKGVVHDD